MKRRVDGFEKAELALDTGNKKPKVSSDTLDFVELKAD